MNKLLFTSLFTFGFVFLKGQITIIGHNEINTSPLQNTTIIVKENGITTQTLNTKSKPDFILKLKFDKNYQVYFNNANCQTMFMEVIGENIPKEKQEINMLHELNVPFVLKNDEDIDTVAFKKAFCRIIYDGTSKMIADTAYSTKFNKTILKNTPVVQQQNAGITSGEIPVIIAGQICLNKNPKLPVTNQVISATDKNGKVLKTTVTNRFGAFAFTGIKASEISKITISLKNNDAANSKLNLLNSNKLVVTEAKQIATNYEWQLKPEDVKNLVNNQYTSNIGGKLLLSSSQQKKFFANKTIYLCNKYNTIIKKTTTNVLGAFVFENIKPDGTYFLGVDMKEVGNGEKLDFLNKDDNYIKFFDTIAGNRRSLKINSNYNELFNSISISDDEMKMNVNAKVYGDQNNKPLGRIKIILLNENYLVIDSVFTDDFGAFKFKYLPFLKRFYLSAQNSDNVLDAFKNILIYTMDDKLVKIITNEKGKRFIYKPIDAEINNIKDIELDDPWLDLIANKKTKTNSTIIENILFETNKTDLLPQAKEVLNKVVLVLNTNKSIKIEISAHTDSKGTDADNLKLSQLRAKTVLNYITAAGIDADRIISIGYGEGKLLNKCKDNVPCSEIEHAQNRRVEFKILEN